MCYDRRTLIGDYPVYEAPKRGPQGLVNTCCFHLNQTLPFYTATATRLQPALIHAHFGFDGYRMAGVARKVGVPLVVSFYGSDVSRLPSEFGWKRRYRKLARCGDRFIAISAAMKEDLLRLGFPEHKLRVVRFGLDLEQFRFNENYTPTGKAMMVGRMVEKKGFIYALRAIKMLDERGQTLRLDLYGDGPGRSRLQKQCRRWGISPLVTFHGFQPVDVIRQAYATHSLLLVPSVTAGDGDREGLPNTLLEGMATGIPVIASRHAAIPEVISDGRNGLLVDEKDSPALAQAISRVITQQVDVNAIRIAARQHIESHYELHRMVRQIERIYCELLTAR